jgi:hypothetical protein
MSINKELEKLYYDPKKGFVSGTKLYKMAKEANIKTTQNEINNFLDNQAVVQIFREQKKPSIFSSIVANHITDEYQMDIMVYDRYQFNKYKYILVIIDIYSRYAEARAMTNRENETIMENIKDIIKVMGKSNIISCDNEFDTIEFKKYCLENKIGANFSEPLEIQKNSIVERFNKTLAGYIKKLREGLKIYNWPKYLPQLMENYNSQYHRTIRNTPYNIFYKKGENKQDIIIVPRTFKINDKVRLRLKKKIFDKGDSVYYSKEVYIIQDINKDIYGTTKYLLSNGKLYTGKNLIKVNDIIYYKPDEINNEEEREFNETKKAIDLNKKLNKVGISQSNIQEGKRIIKKKNYD